MPESANPLLTSDSDVTVQHKNKWKEVEKSLTHPIDTQQKKHLLTKTHTERPREWYTFFTSSECSAIYENKY